MSTRVARWLAELGLGEPDLRCGPQVPDDAPERHRLRAAGEAPCQLHNNCSGKHAGFLMLGQRLGGGPEYVELGHPVQRAVREAFEEMCGAPSPGFGIDGCSAPNFATTVHGLALRWRAWPIRGASGRAREAAARRLVEAMIAHPLLVAGEDRACSELMPATGGQVALKTGAEAVYVAILPGPGLGVALKIEDGATRASECAITALLARLGALDRGRTGGGAAPDPTSAQPPRRRRRRDPSRPRRSGRTGRRSEASRNRVAREIVPKLLILNDNRFRFLPDLNVCHGPHLAEAGADGAVVQALPEAGLPGQASM